MIDLEYERLVALKDVATIMPEGVKPPSYETIRQWTVKGRRGVVLQIVCVGRTKYTSREALERFFRAVTATYQPPKALPVQVDLKASRAAAKRVRAMLGMPPE
jgi:hypothetical protein